MTQGKTIEAITLEELFSENTSGVFPILADIQHDNIVWHDESYAQENGHLRLINDRVSVKYNGYTYMPSSFEFTQPQEDGKKISNTNISISAIDQRVAEIIRSINDVPPILVIEAFFCNLDQYRPVNTFTAGKDYFVKDEYGQYKSLEITSSSDFNSSITKYGTIYIKYTGYAFSKLNHYEFQMTKADWDNVSAKWELIFDPALQVNVPVDTATEFRCPGVNEK